MILFYRSVKSFYDGNVKEAIEELDNVVKFLFEMLIITFCTSVLGDECDSAADCSNLDNSRCHKKKCICKRSCRYNQGKDTCEKSDNGNIEASTPAPTSSKPGDYRDQCTIKSDCKNPLDCRRSRCLCPKGYKYVSRTQSCKKGMVYSNLCCFCSENLSPIYKAFAANIHKYQLIVLPQIS